MLGHGIRQLSSYRRMRCLNFTTCTSTSLAPPRRHRPLVHLSSAPGAKFDGHEIGTPYPILPHEVTSTVRHVDSSVAVPWYADDSLVGTDDVRHEGAKQKDTCNSSMLVGQATERARVLGRITRHALDHALSLLREGITTDEIDESVHNYIVSKGAYPSLLGYRGFPKSTATNINEVVSLGVPDLRPIEAGDVITIVVFCFKDGLHCSASETVIVNGSEMMDDDILDDSQNSRWKRSKRLIHAARDVLDEATREASKHGTTLGNIGSAIHAAANSRECRVVRRLVGHGIGAELQCPPHIEIGSGHDGRDDSSTRLKPGMLLLISPILVEGHSACAQWSNGHTSATVDGGIGAQFGATVILTDDGAEVLTATPASQ